MGRVVRTLIITLDQRLIRSTEISPIGKWIRAHVAVAIRGNAGMFYLRRRVRFQNMTENDDVALIHVAYSASDLQNP